MTCDLSFSGDFMVRSKHFNSDQIKIKIKLNQITPCVNGQNSQLITFYSWVSMTCSELARPCNVRNIQTAAHWLGQPAIIHWGLVLTKGWRCLPSYLPLRISCCIMFFMKWIFLKLFGRGEPDRVRHLKYNTKTSVAYKTEKLCQWDTLHWSECLRIDRVQ